LSSALAILPERKVMVQVNGARGYWRRPSRNAHLGKAGASSNNSAQSVAANQPAQRAGNQFAAYFLLSRCRTPAIGDAFGKVKPN